MEPSTAPAAPAEGASPEARVAVCVATYRRPEGLLRLLHGLNALSLPEGAALEIHVVDNDAAGSAAPACEEARAWLDAPLHLQVEKRRGIPQARNAGVLAVRERADFVAFLDDDEVPDPQWLAELLRVQRAHDADVVTGPCLPRFAGGAPPAWIEEGGFFERPRYRTGARMGCAFTHNALVRADVLRGLEYLFDERLALGGGEDAELFRRLAASGHRIVWADEAIVFEHVPVARARAGWILRRALRIGGASSWIDRQHARGAPVAPRILAHGLWCLARGLAIAATSPGRRARAVEGLRLAAFGVGRLRGLWAAPYEEYRTTTGT